MAMLDQADQRGRGRLPARPIRFHQSAKNVAPDIGKAQIHDDGVKPGPERPSNRLGAVCGQFNQMSLLAQEPPYGVS
jgi:hypothetical protein